MATDKITSEIQDQVTQEEIDNLLKIGDLISAKNQQQKSLVDEIHEAILDSGKLTLKEWTDFRASLKEIEELIPHIDLIINLLKKNRK